MLITGLLYLTDSIHWDGHTLLTHHLAGIFAIMFRDGLALTQISCEVTHPSLALHLYSVRTLSPNMSVTTFVLRIT